MSTRTTIAAEAVTLTVKTRKVKGINYSDGQYDITLVQMKSDKQARVCWKCDGTGYLPEYGFVFEGVCFNCNGSGLGHVYATAAKALDAVRRNLTKQRKDAEQAEAARIANEAAKAEREAKWEAWTASNADVHQYVMDSIGDDNLFVDQMYDLLRVQTPLTDAQSAAVRKIMADQDSQRYGGQVGDKVTFTGKISKTFSGFSDYGVYYMVVIEGIDTHQGVTYKMTGTSKLHIDLQDCEGDVVTIQATVKKHDMYKGIKQTVMLRPKLISHEIAVSVEAERAAEGAEPQWAGLVEVQFAGEDVYRVYPINGTKDAWHLLDQLRNVKDVSYAWFFCFGSEWNQMSFSPESLYGGRGSDKFDSLLDRDNTNYAVTSYRRDGSKDFWRTTVAEHNLLVEWRKAFGALQMHVQERGHGTHHACQVSGVQRWGCPEWIKMNKPVEELEKKMMDAGMTAPYAVLERPAR